MVRPRDGDGIKSNMIVSEVQKRACLFDTNHPNYGDRAEKAKCWEEVYEVVVPGYLSFGMAEKYNAGKEVQKRWRSIRDSYTKAFRQGKCVSPEACPAGSRRYMYHKQMAFLLKALQNKKPRYSQDNKYESFSEVSNSPQHPPPEDMPKIKHETIDKPLDLKTKPDTERIEKPETQDKGNQATIENKNLEKLEIKIDANSILPDDHFDDDKLFMNSLIPLFKKMNDDTRLLCRIEVLKIIRYALQGHRCFEALKMAEDSFFKNRMSGILAKEEVVEPPKSQSTLSMTTRSADGSRPVRKRKIRSPSPIPQQQYPPKRRGPGRPRKIRPPPSDSDEDPPKKRSPKMKPLTDMSTNRSSNSSSKKSIFTSNKSTNLSMNTSSDLSLNKSTNLIVNKSGNSVANLSTDLSEMDESLSKATSVAHLSTPLFMKIYNLERSKDAPILPSYTPQTMQVSVKTEPIENEAQPA